MYSWFVNKRWHWYILAGNWSLSLGSCTSILLAWEFWSSFSELIAFSRHKCKFKKRLHLILCSNLFAWNNFVCDFSVRLPTDPKDQNEKLKRFILCINQELEDLYLGIKKALDENCRSGFVILLKPSSQVLGSVEQWLPCLLPHPAAPAFDSQRSVEFFRCCWG